MTPPTSPRPLYPEYIPGVQRSEISYPRQLSDLIGGVMTPPYVRLWNTEEHYGL